MDVHARVAPSALHLTVPCPGSLQMQERVPPMPESDAEAEGTVAHLVAMRRAASAAPCQLGDVIQHNGRPWTVDEDMLDGAALFASAVHPAGRFEQTVKIPDIPDCWGTPDYFYYTGPLPKGEYPFLDVTDYKYGHRPVEVFENLQLAAYAIGVLALLSQAPEPISLGMEVWLRIVQPRAYHTDGPVRVWKTHVAALREFVASRIVPAVQEALGTNPRTVAGGHCLNCRARASCETLRYSAATVVDFAGTVEPQELSPAAMGQELRILSAAQALLNARYEGLHAQAENLARAGHAIPWWSLQPGRGSFAWEEDTQDMVMGAAKMMGIDVLKPAALVTPTQAIKQGLAKEVVESFATRRTGKLSLKPDDTTAFRKVFGANNT